MVIGEGEKFVGALIIPNFGELKKWCIANNIDTKTNEIICQNKTVQAMYRKVIDDMNVNFNHVEQVKKFRLLPIDWSVVGGELTPTLKLKRKVILEHCKLCVESIYRNAEK